MSSTIDERVVELRFDNKQFESGVKESLATLEKLKDATNKNISSKSFEGIQKAANSLDISNISKGIDALQSRFSTIGVAGMRVISNITDGLMNGLGGAIHSVTNSIVSGGIKRAMNIENAHFQLQGLIKDEKEVQAVMEQANESVDGTAYSYDVAAKAASMFAASGIKSGKQMENALKGIAGTAATANADYERISELFTTIAGKGRIQAMELNRFASMGMNAAAALTNYMNDVNSGAVEASESVTDAIKNITKGSQITEETLRDLVSKGLVSFEIFSEGMATTFGDHAKDANQTFTGAMSNIKAALARTGAMFVSPLIQQNGPFVQFFNAIRVKVNEFNKALGATNGIAKQFTTWVNNMVTSLTKVVEGFNIANVYTRTFGDGVEKTFTDVHHRILTFGDGTKKVMQGDFYTPFSAFTDVIASIVNIFKGLRSVITPIGQAFKEAFSFDVTNLYKAIESFRNMTSHFKLSEQTAKNLHDAFKGVFDVIRLTITLFGRLLAAIFPINGAVGEVGDSFIAILGAAGRWLSTMTEIISKSELLNTIFSTIKSVVTIASDALKTLWSYITGAASGLEFDFLKDFKLNLENLPSPIESIKNAFIGFKNVIVDVAGVVAEHFGGKSAIFSKIEQIATKLSDIFGKLKENITNSIKEYGPLEAVFKTLNGTLLAGILLKLSKISETISKDPSKGLTFFGSIKKTITELGNAFKRVSAGLAKDMKSLSHLIDAKAIKELAIAIAILAGSLWFLSTLSYNQITKGLGAISALLYEIMGAMTLLDKGLAGSDNLKDALTGIMDSIKIGMLASALLKIAAAVLILSIAVKSLGSINLADLAKGLGAVTILLGEMMALMLILSKIGVEKMTSVGLGMILIAAAVKVLASSVKDLGAVKIDEVIQGLIAVGALLLELGIFTSMAGGAEKTISVGIGMMLVSGAIKVLASVIKDLSALNINQVAQGLAAIAGVLLSLGIFAMLAGGAKKMIVTSAAMIVLSYALKKIAESLIDLSGMTWNQVGKSLASMFGALAILTAALLMLGKVKAWKLAKGIVALNSIIEIVKAPMSEMLMELAKLSWEQIGRSLTAMAGTFLIMIGAIFLLRKFKIKDLVKSVLALKSMSNSALLLSAGLVKLASIGWEGVKAGLTAFGGALGELIVAVFILSEMPLKRVVQGVIALMFAVKAIVPIAPLMTNLASISWNGMITSLIAFGGAMAILIAAIFAIGKVPIDSALFGILELAIAVRAIQPIVPLMQGLASIGWEGMKTALLAFGGAMSILVLAMLGAGGLWETGIPMFGTALLALLTHTIMPIVPLMQGLASIGWEGMKTSLLALGGAMGILVLAMNLAGALWQTGIPEVGTICIAIIVRAIQPIVPLMQGLSKINFEGAKSACLALGGALAILIVAMCLAGMAAPYTATGAGVLYAIGQVFPNLASGIQVLSTVNWNEIKDGCKAFALSMLTMLVTLIVIGMAAPLAIAGAGALGTIITVLIQAISFNSNAISNVVNMLTDSITKFMDVVNILSEVDQAKFDKAINCVTSLVTAIATTLKSFGLTGGIRALGFVEMAEGMQKLVDVIKILNEVDGDKVGNGLTKVGTSLETFGKSLKSFQLLSGIRAIGFTKMCDGLRKLVDVFAVLNRVNPKRVGESLIWVAQGMSQMGKALNSYNPALALGQANSMFVVAQAIEKLAPAVKTLSTIPLGQVTTILSSLGTAFEDFGTALDNTPFWGSGMRANGIGVLCDNIATLTEVLPGFIAIAGGEGGRYAKQALNILGTAFKDFGIALDATPFWGEDSASGINALCAGIGSLNEALPGFIAITAGEGGRYATQALNILGTAFKDFGTALLNTPILNADERGQGIVTIVNSITTLSDGIKTFVTDVGTGENVKTAFSMVGGAFANFGRALLNTPIFNADERGQGLAIIAANVKSLAQGVKDFITIVNKSDAETLKKVMTLIQTAFMDFGVALRTAGFINPQGKADAIVAVVNSVDTLADGVERFIKMEPDVEKLSTIMGAIGTSFKDFGLAIKKAGFWDVEGRANAIVTVVDSIGTLVSCIEQVKGINITYLQQLLGSFAGGIIAIGTSLQSFDEMATTNAGIVKQVVENISLLTTYTKDQYIGAIEGINGLIGVLTNIGKFDTASLTQFNTALKKTATEGLQTFLDAFTTKAEEAVTAVKTLMDAIIQALDEYTDDFEQMGKKHGEAYIKGLRSMYEQAYTAGKMLGMKAYSGLELQIKNFEKIGLLCAQGFANGLKSSEALKAIADAAAAVGQQAVQSTQQAVQTESPSRVFMKIGNYCGEGLAIGLYQWADAVAEAGNSLGESAKTGLQMAVENLNNHMDEIVDLNPTITPVVDLTYASAAASKINSMFSSAMFRTSSDVRSVSSMVQGGRISGDSEEIQNGRFGNNYTFVQNNNSPKALSRLDIYRDTKNLLRQVEGV